MGSRLASDMSRDGQDVTIVDRDPAALNKAAERGVLGPDFRGNAMVGDGCDADLLRRAGIEDADGFVAVTEGDNRNIMAAQIAQHVFKVPRVVCRISDPIRYEAYRKLGLNSFCPTTDQEERIHAMILEQK